MRRSKECKKSRKEHIIWKANEVQRLGSENLGCSRNRGKHTLLEHHKADGDCCYTVKKATEGVFNS